MDKGNDIKAVFFDIDDTLYGFTNLNARAKRGVYQYLVEKYPVSWEKFEEIEQDTILETVQRLGSNHPTSHNRLIRFQNMLTKLGIPVYPYAKEMYDRYWNLIIENVLPEAGLKELLQKLKSYGIYLGIGTNMTIDIQIRKLEKLGIVEYFDYVVTSEEVGIGKPSVYFFEFCAKKAGCKMSECLFVGDSLKNDIQGARDAGMHAVCYNRYSMVKEKDAEETVSSYLECVALEKVQIGNMQIYQ